MNAHRENWIVACAAHLQAQGVSPESTARQFAEMEFVTLCEDTGPNLWPDPEAVADQLLYELYEAAA